MMIWIRSEVTRRQSVEAIVKVMGGEAELFQIIGANHLVCRLAHLLDGWKKQSHQKTNDSDYDQELNQGKR